MSDAKETHPVRKVIGKIVETKTIDADQVRELEKFVAEDWVIDQHEVKLLFRINHAVGSKDEDCPQWSEFFVRSINRLVVMDMNTPGQVDEDEGNLIADLLDEYSNNNDSEKKLLFDLQNTTSKIDGRLAKKIQSFQ